MRYFVALFFGLSILGCGEGVEKNDQPVKAAIVEHLRLTEVANGLPVDTMQSSLRISLLHSSDTTVADQLIVRYDSVAGAPVINVFADSSIAVLLVDSVINATWNGQDVCLIGVNNGQELGIPFHGLHRFPPEELYHVTLPGQYFNLKIFADHFEVNDWAYHYRQANLFFAPFYSDAFSPVDSSSKYPSRTRQSVDALMMEGAAWDGVEFRQGADSALRLAAYNEFVNKLEIFDKAGPFWTLRVAMIDVTYDASVAWGTFMKVAGHHFHHLYVKRNEAKQYLSDYIANKGTEVRDFTAEDLRLLYPDKLRWNGFISGEAESRYDPDMLIDWK